MDKPERKMTIVMEKKTLRRSISQFELAASVAVGKKGVNCKEKKFAPCTYLNCRHILNWRCCVTMKACINLHAYRPLCFIFFCDIYFNDYNSIVQSGLMKIDTFSTCEVPL